MECVVVDLGHMTYKADLAVVFPILQCLLPALVGAPCHVEVFLQRWTLYDAVIIVVSVGIMKQADAVGLLEGSPLQALDHVVLAMLVFCSELLDLVGSLSK